MVRINDNDSINYDIVIDTAIFVIITMNIYHSKGLNHNCGSHRIEHKMMPTLQVIDR